MSIITRLNTLPKEYHNEIFKAVMNVNFETIVKSSPLILEFRNNNYQLSISHKDYLILKEYIRELKLKRLI